MLVFVNLQLYKFVVVYIAQVVFSSRGIFF